MSNPFTPGQMALFDQSIAGIDGNINKTVREFREAVKTEDKELVLLSLIGHLATNSHEALAQHAARMVQRLAEHEPPSDPSLPG